MIYAVIVNYNSGDRLRNLISQLDLEVDGDICFVVVDNASDDDSLSRLSCKRYCGYDLEKTEWFISDIHVMKNQKNLLYAKAANQGIKFALKQGAEYILLVNYDIRIERGFLEKMAGRKGITAPVIYYDTIWSKGGWIDWKKKKMGHIGLRQTG